MAMKYDEMLFDYLEALIELKEAEKSLQEIETNFKKLEAGESLQIHATTDAVAATEAAQTEKNIAENNLEIARKKVDEIKKKYKFKEPDQNNDSRNDSSDKVFAFITDGTSLKAVLLNTLPAKHIEDCKNYPLYYEHDLDKYYHVDKIPEKQGSSFVININSESIECFFDDKQLTKLTYSSGVTKYEYSRNNTWKRLNAIEKLTDEEFKSFIEKLKTNINNENSDIKQKWSNQLEREDLILKIVEQASKTKK